jgi:hypothetical protein
MINYFLSHKEIFEISNVCAQLKKLKMRINAGDYDDSCKEYNKCKDSFDKIKRIAIELNDERLANSQIVFRNYFLLFCHLSSYFSLLQKRNYKVSWSALQDCFDDLRFVGKYLEIEERKEMPDIYKLLEAYEALYPYKVFFSSEYIISKSHCSICGKSMQSLSCPHIKGNLYWGDIALDIVDEIEEFQDACLVEYPEDKRCIIELSDDNRSESDQFAKLGQFLELKQPFLQQFSITTVMETRQRTDIVKVGRNDPCSCGSGIKFKKCCGKNLYYQHERNIIHLGKKVQLV